jgi:hypothetical protein
MKTLIVPAMMLALLATPALSDSSVTVTHGKTPDPTYIDLGPAGDSAGDQRIWEFGGQTAEGEPVVMDWLMITTGQPEAASGLESRMTSAVFSFGSGTNDRILVQGIGLYPVHGSTAKIAATLERAIIGGTGKYAGATGIVVTTHLEDGTWRHVLNVK